MPTLLKAAERCGQRMVELLLEDWRCARCLRAVSPFSGPGARPGLMSKQRQESQAKCCPRLGGAKQSVSERAFADKDTASRSTSLHAAAKAGNPATATALLQGERGLARNEGGKFIVRFYR